MKKIINPCLKLISKAVAAASLFLVSMAAGTISIIGVYEPEMPAVLRPKEGEET